LGEADRVQQFAGRALPSKYGSHFCALSASYPELGGNANESLEDRKMSYWSDVRRESWQRTKLKMFSRERRLFSLVVPLISAGIAVALLSILQQPIPLSIAITVVSAFGGFAIVAAWEWFHELFAIPAEREQAISTRLREKEAVLNAPRPDPMRIELTYAEFASATPTISVAHFNATIRNSGAETTLEWPRLRSAIYGDIATCTNCSLDERAGIIEIGERKKKIGSLSFKINSPLDQLRLPDNKWWVEFADIEGRTYKADVPATSYVDLRKWQSPNP
jgi:hypothetical protein